MSELVERGMERSVDLLRRAAGPAGFVASPGLAHYEAVWSRDAAIACLGAVRTGDTELIAAAARTLRTMARLASPLGRVPDAYWPARNYWDWGEAGTTDATAWFVIALDDHVGVTADAALAIELRDPVERAIKWLAHQDVTGWGVIDSPAGGDWMDSSLNRSGRVFHVNVLYWRAVSGHRRLANMWGRTRPDEDDAARVRRAVEAVFWPEPGFDPSDLLPAGRPEGGFPHPLTAAAVQRLADPSREHYLASVSYGRFVDRCDVLANLLAVGFGLAGADRAGRIMDYLERAAVTEPFPSRVWVDPFDPDDPAGIVDPVADAAQDPRWRNPPNEYHNGAVWPYVGAVHALALRAVGRPDAARAVLERVAAANELAGWRFSEWIHGATGEPAGAPDQTWNAGAYVWAHAAIAQT